MVSTSIDFFRNEWNFHPISEKEAKERLISYAHELDQEHHYRIYNTYLIHPNEEHRGSVILKIYNAAKQQFENHWLSYDLSSQRILLKTGHFSAFGYKTLRELISDIEKPILAGTVTTAARAFGSVLMSVDRRMDINTHAYVTLASIVNTIFHGKTPTAISPGMSTPLTPGMVQGIKTSPSMHRHFSKASGPAAMAAGAGSPIVPAAVRPSTTVMPAGAAAVVRPATFTASPLASCVVVAGVSTGVPSKVEVESEALEKN